ncbi:hypothetical protein LOK74_02040 [Brevibacillus humidisoli]|uniref:JAB domain-containing protein n=1 Tax=Brevibacillus humidisoli TaxID=2895522 RepID=UPI001E34282C|nr:JAB domain-containing protein [Brevibacillus humidisoli]UFJ41341.1 hypothetical protein LOK74_02040 [Brevibacillus humidisoli]
MNRMSFYRPTFVKITQFSSSNKRIKDSVEAVYLFRTFAEIFHRGKQEILLVMSLDEDNRLLGMEVIPVKESQPLRASEVFAGSILRKANAIKIGRFTTSDLMPSPSDEWMAIRLTKAGDFLGIAVKDFIIITDKQYFSLMDDGSKESQLPTT